MALKLYWISGSPYAWRVMLALEAKGIPYQSQLLQADQGDLEKPEFLAINPLGTVPVLVDDDFVLTESIAILAYLERRFPTPPLFGETDRNYARIWESMSETVFNYDLPIRDIAGTVYFRDPKARVTELRETAATIHRHLKRREEKLDRQPWLAGNTMTAADFTFYPTLMTLLRAAGKPAAEVLDLGILPLDQHYPALAAWSRRIEALPYHDRTYPPHWKPQTQAAQ